MIISLKNFLFYSTITLSALFSCVVNSQGRVNTPTVEDVFRNADAIALVLTDSVVKINQHTGDKCKRREWKYEIKVKLINSYGNGRISDTVCSDIPYCIDCHLFVAVRKEGDQQYFSRAWVVEDFGRGQIVRPGVGDSLLPFIDLRAEDVGICSDNSCKTVTLFRYFLLEDVVRFAVNVAK